MGLNDEWKTILLINYHSIDHLNVSHFIEETGRPSIFDWFLGIYQNGFQLPAYVLSYLS